MTFQFVKYKNVKIVIFTIPKQINNIQYCTKILLILISMVPVWWSYSLNKNKNAVINYYK